MKFSRHWCMPSRDTFQMRPMADLLDRVLHGRADIADPFARTSKRAKWSNDLNPEFGHQFSLDAREFAAKLTSMGVMLDAVLFDPPYSPRQVTECYSSVGLRASMEDTQTAALYSGVKSTLSPLCRPGAVAICFGWNTVGFGKERGWELVEVMTVCHGGAHNDTLVTVEMKQQGDLFTPL